MHERTYKTEYGTIHYWTGEFITGRKNLVFLPGLTADHRLFDLQIEHFEKSCNVLVWDAPGHAASRPFELKFELSDKAKWLHEILQIEGFSAPVLIGQSMGGYVSQAYLQQFPGNVSAFISIDSATLKKKYSSSFDRWFMKNSEVMYRMYPWKALLRDGSAGCAETPYGIDLMRRMIDTYSDDPKYYSRLCGHGYRMLANAINKDLPYEVNCPAILICGEKDKAGFTRKYNEKWSEGEKLPVHRIPNAGHNSNTDRPELVNALIEDFLSTL